jgi:hypothetical protein
VSIIFESFIAGIFFMSDIPAPPWANAPLIDRVNLRRSTLKEAAGTQDLVVGIVDKYSPCGFRYRRRQLFSSHR